jgi:hypothetical protein
VDLLLVAAIGAALTVLFLRPGDLHGYPFPVGPDAPVYMWWAKVAAGRGVSLVGERPGTPVLIPSLGALLGAGIVPALAGLQYALGPAIGLAATGLSRGRGAVPRPAWIAGGLLAGTWATFLGGGYVANLAFVAPYLAAGAARTRRTPRGAGAPAVLFGGAGLAHPQFFAVGAVILALAAGLSSLLDERFSWSGDSGRALVALVGGGTIVAAGLVAALGGPPHLAGDTSKDAFLRRAGRWDALRQAYLERASDNWRRYAPFMTSALSVAGLVHGRAFKRRFLAAWTGFTVVMIPIGALTGWYPPDRILTFAFCLPLLAGIGLVWLGEKLGRWWLAWPAGILLASLMAYPAVRDWDDVKAYVSSGEMAAANLAGRIAATTEPGTPLVFVANDPTTPSLFLASHSLNVARAAVPSDRIEDVYVYVGTPENLLAGVPTLRGDDLYDLASRDSLAQIPSTEPMAVFVVSELNRDPVAFENTALTRWAAGVATTVPDPRPLPPPEDEIAPSDAGEIRAATLRTLLLLFVLGMGWAWWCMGDVPGAVAIAPAFGVATLTIAALALERLGFDFASPGVATVAAMLAGGSGYALFGLRILRQPHRRVGETGAGLQA